MKSPHGSAQLFSMAGEAVPANMGCDKQRSHIMSLQSSIIANLASVQADMNYLAPMLERPRNYTFEPPPGVPRSNTVNVSHRVPIHDARRVHIFDHTTRRRVPDAQDRSDAPRQPVQRVHIDHTARSGPQRVRDLLPDEADELLKGRVQVINLWRPIKGPVQDSPLAVCDATTIDLADLVPSDLVYQHRIGETYSVKYNPAHRWFYVPRMQPDEALLLKCSDTKTDVPARFTPHSAFIDPTASADAPPRESIEVRTLVFHR